MQIGMHRAGLQRVTQLSVLRETMAKFRKDGKTVGFIPTMGALHRGHLSLLAHSKMRCDVSCVSIFVNPTQFEDPNDFTRYPYKLEKDADSCANCGADVLWTPTPEEMYPKGYDLTKYVHCTVPMVAAAPSASGAADEAVAAVVCAEAASRKGHFDAVATVVLRLLNAVQPDVAFFGEKDAAQCAVVRRMASDLLLPTEIAVCPTVREKSGLAMSSRNERLSAVQRQYIAPELQAGLQVGAGVYESAGEAATCEAIVAAVTAHVAKTRELRLEYVDIADPLTMESLSAKGATTAGQRPPKGSVLSVAAAIDAIRLIDNITL